MATHPIPDSKPPLRPLPPELEAERARLIALLDEADRSIDEGHGIEVTKESMREMAERVKARGRVRLQSEMKNS